MGTIPILKEQVLAETPLLLFDVTFGDGTISRWSTHAVNYGGHAYAARVLRHNFFEIQAMSPQGIDQIPSMTLVLANADSEMSQLDAAKGFKGATITATFVFYSVATNSPASDALVPFTGYFNPPDQVDDLELKVTAINRMNMQRVNIPPAKIQRRCPWAFPTTLAQRTAAASDPNSPYYPCGYSPDVAGGSGRFQSGTTPFTSCTFTRQACIAHGMFSQDESSSLVSSTSPGATSVTLTTDIAVVGAAIDIDGGADPTTSFAIQEERRVTGKSGSGPYTYTLSSALTRSHSAGAKAGRPTRRFGGIEFVPQTINVRPFGYPGSIASPVQPNAAQYNDPIPMVYGTAWTEPVVTVLRNDGNLTRMECLLSLGRIQGVRTVVVSGYQIPAGIGGQNMTASGWYTLVHDGDPFGEFDLNFADGAGNPQSDPYGSMAYLSVVVPNKINNGTSLPQIQVLMDGRFVETFDSSGNSLGWSFSNNSAWILLDILKQGRWKTGDIDLPSFAAAAAFCDTTISGTDNNGNSVIVPRFQCNLVLQNRRPAAEVLLGVRSNARLFFTYGTNGKLQLRTENTIAAQQPSLPYGSNAIATVNGGWPAYSYDASSILRLGSGASSLRVSYRSIADTPNRLSFEFQDAFNGYVQDSFAIDDVVDQQTVGQEISQTLIVDGIPTYDQAARVAKFQLDKTILGNLYVNFQTTVKALGQQVGQIITITYPKEGWVARPFRILKLAPQQNYRTVLVTAQAHDDAWYSDANGQFTPPYGRPRQPGAVSRAPYPLVGTASRADGDFDWSISESPSSSSDGVGTVQLTVPFAVPVNAFSTVTGPPVANLNAPVTSTGGSLPGTETLYYALTATDAGAAESPASFAITATIPAGTNTNTVTITGIAVDSGAATFSVYRGATPVKMFRIASGLTAAATFQDTGIAPQAHPLPDAFFDHADFFWKFRRSGLSTATIFGASQVGAAGLSMTTNQFAGCIARISAGTGAGETRTITANSTTTLTVTPPWITTPDGTSIFSVEDPDWKAGSSAASSPAQFEIPNQAGRVVLIQGLAADTQDLESLDGLAVVTPWTIGGVGPGVSDIGVPATPQFSISTTRDGTVSFSPPSFATSTNTAGISSATYQVNLVDELNPASTTLTTSITSTATTMQVASSSAFLVGDLAAIDQETILIQGIAGTTWTVARGRQSTTAASHILGAAIYRQVSKVFVYSFELNFFGSTAAALWSARETLPFARIASVSLRVTNAFGDSATTVNNYLLFDDESAESGSAQGIRTSLGGQFTIQVPGVLFVESSPAAPLPVHTTVSVRDVYAIAGTPPAGASVTVLVRRNGSPYATVSIPSGSTFSNAVSGATLAPLQAGDLLTIDITGVGSSTPGSDLTVVVRL